MVEQTFFDWLLISWFIIAAIIFVALFFIVAPYGRHSRGNWGLTLSNKLGWVVMEAASPLVFATCFVLGSNPRTATSLAFLALWEAHYLHRAFIYPFSLRGTAERMPLAVVSLGILFNAVNAYLNGRYIYTFSPGYPNQWLADPRFITGLGIFIIGFVVNRQADHTLRGLRTGGESGYQIPYGGMYRWISCPNYFGEILIWVGWAVATWSLPGLAFALWTMANLLPRARAHHRWYLEHFPDYPHGRKALVPGIW
jgi:protein-S-isoprenylcysteine O-methyltransferase Ste14